MVAVEVRNRAWAKKPLVELCRPEMFREMWRRV
jgi:hypothetical protein